MGATGGQKGAGHLGVWGHILGETLRGCQCRAALLTKEVVLSGNSEMKALFIPVTVQDL